jgi:hypothetical protein
MPRMLCSSGNERTLEILKNNQPSSPIVAAGVDC